ncbi:MAG TPA: hypothetical protein DIW31_02935 [Bacteroidales bacterium]|nr:hypothetical protein [Bacteroidales bacterium]
MREFSIISVALLNLTITIRYCRLLYKQEIKPALAMWVFFTIAVGMSLITYLAKDNFSIWDNILNTTDLILVLTISIAIAIWGDKSSKFTKFDAACLIAVIVSILFWAITKNHLVTNLSIQLIMVVSYFPVIKRLFESKANTEPFSVWIMMMLVPVFSLLSSKGLLATIYSVRAIVCVGLLLLLMLRVEMLRKRE